MISVKLHLARFYWAFSFFPPRLEFTDRKLIQINHQINQTEAVCQLQNKILMKNSIKMLYGAQKTSVKLKYERELLVTTGAKKKLANIIECLRSFVDTQQIEIYFK